MFPIFFLSFRLCALLAAFSFTEYLNGLIVIAVFSLALSFFAFKALSCTVKAFLWSRGNASRFSLNNCICLLNARFFSTSTLCLSRELADASTITTSVDAFSTTARLAFLCLFAAEPDEEVALPISFKNALGVYLVYTVLDSLTLRTLATAGARCSR